MAKTVIRWLISEARAGCHRLSLCPAPPPQLGVREALVVEQAAQRGSRLQRTTSDESSLIHSPLPGGRGGEEEEGDEVVSTRRPVSPTKRQIAAAAAAAARPAVPNLRLKLPGR